MDPTSPSKLVMSPGMPVFPVSPERVAGTRPPYGVPGTPQSPSLPDLRTSPLRKHRRDDSNVSALASMFENFQVTDPKEAHTKYLQNFEKQKAKHETEIQELKRKHADALHRLELRNEELKAAAKEARDIVEDTIPRDTWDEMRQKHREAIGKWEDAMRRSEETRKQAERKCYELKQENKVLKAKSDHYKTENHRLSKESMRASSYLPTMTTKIQGLEQNARRLESDLKFQTGEAEKYKNMVYGLQVDLESVEGRLGEEVQTLRDKLRLVEGERDALKTSLKEEEVLRIAAEGRIALPATTPEEQDEFASPVRSPRKQRSPERDDDKENVAPRKLAVELKFVQQELTTERRLRVRAEDQIDFMKMECQFRCCSCRIADMKGSNYVHDGSYITEMERIKASVPELTPPASSHEDELMDLGVIIKEEPIDDARPISPPLETVKPTLLPAFEEDRKDQPEAQTVETSEFPLASSSPAEEATVAFSPTTGTFRAVPSPVKALVSMHAPTPAKPSAARVSNVHVQAVAKESSRWTPEVDNTKTEPEEVSLPHAHPAQNLRQDRERKMKSQTIAIHEDAVADSDDEGCEPQTPLYGPSGPATPFFTRTITTTTTIPLHFSPLTPARKGVNHSLTPSTVAHAPTNAQSQALGEVSLNALPIDREAALEMIRQRRGRARSMAAGNATPGKQMMEGVKERRDISAPVYRVRR